MGCFHYQLGKALEEKRKYMAVACPHCGRACVAEMGTRRRQCP
ncbi:MAG: hypothetical protein ACK4SY_07290 [Pyrobaculum sp.]